MHHEGDAEDAEDNEDKVDAAEVALQHPFALLPVMASLRAHLLTKCGLLKVMGRLLPLLKEYLPISKSFVILKHKKYKFSIHEKFNEHLSLLNPFHPACHHLCLPHHGKDHKKTKSTLNKVSTKFFLFHR